VVAVGQTLGIIAVSVYMVYAESMDIGYSAADVGAAWILYQPTLFPAMVIYMFMK
jgi:hypothetical protein